MPADPSSKRRLVFQGGMLNTSMFQTDADEDKEARAHIKADVADGAASAFAMLARFGLKAAATQDCQQTNHRAAMAYTYTQGDKRKSTNGDVGTQASPDAFSGARAKWLRGTSKMEANTAARRMREVARLKALQRTPYPMVLARLKLLLERRDMLLAEDSFPGSPTRSILRGASPSGRRPSAASGAELARSPTKTRSPMRTSPEPLDSVPGISAELQPLEKVREELAVTFSYVSDFLRKVPEETRIASIDYARMENFKKDQTVYKIGDEPHKFYIILTGAVEVWSHPVGEPRNRTVLAQLKRGQSFGEKDILNGDLRTECITPTSNCTFLIVDAEPFKTIFSDHFEALLARAQDFFMHHVTMFSKIPEKDGHAIVRHMLLSTYPAGQEWEPQAEAQIYFIKTGSATLESHDRKGNSVVITRAMLGLNEADSEIEAPAVGDSGVLANVILKNGRAVGTLGHEEEIRRLKRQLVPKKVIATLDRGSHFGGGAAAMGQGDLQASLRVMATADIEAYHCHVEVFMKHASPELLSALRDDVAFKLTYCYGRVDMLGGEVVVGHPSSLLATCLNKPKESTAGGPAPASGKDSLMQAIPATTGRSAVKRKKAIKHTHEPGRYNPEVEKALWYIKSLQAHNQMVQAGAMDSMAKAKLVGTSAAEGTLPVPGYMEYLVSVGATPSERFWSVPALNASSHRSTGLAPLLKQVYPEGLGPLADKIDQLVTRTRQAAEDAGRPLTCQPFHHDSSSGRGAMLDATSRTQQAGVDRSRPGLGSPNCPLPRSTTRPQVPSSLRRTSSSMQRSPLQDTSQANAPDFSWDPKRWYDGVMQEQARPATAPSSTGALISAGLVWEREHETARAPALRQILTFEEIARLKVEFMRPSHARHPYDRCQHDMGA